MADEWPTDDAEVAEEEDWDEEAWDEDVETFIETNGLDEKAAAALRVQSPEVTQFILSRGAIVGGNPSAITMSRIRDAGGELKAGGAAGSAKQDFDTFVSVVDTSARDALVQCGQDVVQAVMADGPLDGNNPSAVLMGRIRKAKKTLGSSKAPKPAGGVASAGSSKSPKSTGAVAGDRNGVPNSQAVSQGNAVKSLSSLLCTLNSNMWNFDVPQKDLLTTFKEAVAARDAIGAVVASRSQLTDSGPPQKKRRQVASDQEQSTDSNRRELIVQEVVRILEANGGQLELHRIGNKSLSDMRKGVVGNLRTFLTSWPDVFEVTEQEGGSSPLVSLVGSTW